MGCDPNAIQVCLYLLTKKATQKIWILLHLKRLGGNHAQLLVIYIARVRSVLEFAALVFSSGLIKDLSSKIETVKRKALAMILGNLYGNYESALHCLCLHCLDNPRHESCFNSPSNAHHIFILFPKIYLVHPNKKISQILIFS